MAKRNVLVLCYQLSPLIVTFIYYREDEFKFIEAITYYPFKWGYRRMQHMDSIFDEFKDVIFMDREKLSRKYELIGRGSSRAVFEIDKNYVLKVPTSEKGIYQCRVEYKLYSIVNDYYKRYLCPIELYENNRLIMKKAVPLKKSSYPRGFRIYDLLNLETRNEFRYDLKYLANTYDLLYVDLLNISSWGKFNGRYVLVDYGCTNRIYDAFY